MKNHTIFHHTVKPLLKSLVVINVVFGLAYSVYLVYHESMNGSEAAHDRVISAAHDGDIKRVGYWSAYDSVLSRTGFEEHVTPLIAAVQGNHTDVVPFLLDKKLDVHSKDDFGRTALVVARSKGNKVIINLLTDAGARY